MRIATQISGNCEVLIKVRKRARRLSVFANRDFQVHQYYICVSSFSVAISRGGPYKIPISIGLVSLWCIYIGVRCTGCEAGCAACALPGQSSGSELWVKKIYPQGEVQFGPYIHTYRVKIRSWIKHWFQQFLYTRIDSSVRVAFFNNNVVEKYYRGCYACYRGFAKCYILRNPDNMHQNQQEQD